MPFPYNVTKMDFVPTNNDKALTKTVEQLFHLFSSVQKTLTQIASPSIMFPVTTHLHLLGLIFI